MTGQADYLALGDYNAVCFECGRKRKASTLRKHWQGYYVCPEHWEPRQPQDFVRSIPDVITPPWTQPRPADVFVTPLSITPTGATLVDVGGSWLTTPSAAANQFSTNMRIVAWLGKTNWLAISQTLLAKVNTLTNIGYLLDLTAGFITFTMSSDGTLGGLQNFSSSVALPSSLNNTFQYIKVTFTGDNGTGNSQVVFEYSANGVTYTQLGTTVLGTIASIFASTAPITVKILDASIRSVNLYNSASATPKVSLVGNDAGLLILPDALGRTTASWTSAISGETWTLTNTASITPKTAP